MTHSTQRRRHGTKKEPLATESLHTNARSRCGTQTQGLKRWARHVRRERKIQGTSHGECNVSTGCPGKPSDTLRVAQRLRTQLQEFASTSEPLENIFHCTAQHRRSVRAQFHEFATGDSGRANVHSCACSAHTRIHKRTPLPPADSMLYKKASMHVYTS